MEEIRNELSYVGHLYSECKRVSVYECSGQIIHVPALELWLNAYVRPVLRLIPARRVLISKASNPI